MANNKEMLHGFTNVHVHIYSTISCIFAKPIGLYVFAWEICVDSVHPAK